MTIIVCTDDRGGMLFNRRRQSRDRVIYPRILEHTEGVLWMTSYSRSLFEEDDRIRVDEQYENTMTATDSCFVEDGVLPLEHAERLILYRWNRHYPADRVFPDTPEAHGFVKVSSRDLTGHSHECITEEIYQKKGVLI